MFSCPKCNERLIRTKTPNGFVFACRTCHGQAVALAVVRKVVAADQARSLWKRATGSRVGRGVLCPACGRRTAEVSVSVAPESGVDLDICTRCQFVWFDGQELEQLPRQLPKAIPSKELSSKARKAIALAQVAQISKQARGDEIGDEGPDDAWKWIPAMFGFPIEHDLHPIRTLPWLTWSLALVLVAVTAWAWATNDLAEMIQQYGLIPAEVGRHGGVTFFTNVFLHAGVLHLLGNVYFLIIFGDNVEDYLGSIRYMALLVCAALVGNLVHLLGQIQSEIPCVGASGAISGIVVFYALQFPQARLGLLFRFYYIFKWVYFPAYIGLIGWVLWQLFMTYQQIAGLSKVSALAHLGGAMTGLCAWLLWRRRSTSKASTDDRLERARLVDWVKN